MAKQKIAFLLFSMTGAGEERIASILLHDLYEDYEMHLVLFNGPIEYKLPPNIKVTYLRKHYSWFLLRSLSLILVFFRYLKYCKNNDIGFSLSFDNVPNYINCLLKFSSWNGSVFIREVTFASKRFENGLRSRVHRFLIKSTYTLADNVYVNANRIQNDLVNQFGIKRQQIKLFNNPIDIKLIEQQSKATFSETDRFTFIHVGAFRSQKNHALLIEAFAKIKHMDFTLLLLGKGPLENDIKKGIQSNGLSSKVCILGFQDNPYIFMANADLMVLSSDFEGLPNVLLESLACKLPVVSTNCPSGPLEVLSGNPVSSPIKLDSSFTLLKHGILCPVGNSDVLSQALAYCIENSSSNLLEEFKAGMEDTLSPYLKDNVLLEFRKDLRHEG